MQATRKTNDIRLCDKLCVDTIELQTLCGCGRAGAIKLATEAGARIQLGKRVLWSVPKLQTHLEKISGAE